MSCPVCAGPKSKRARLCASCRQAAIAAGVNLITGQPSQALLPGLPLTDGQRRAFHAKANRIDAVRGEPIGTTKRDLLAAAGVASTNDLSQSQASDLLDLLDEQLRAVQMSESTAP